METTTSPSSISVQPEPPKETSEPTLLPVPAPILIEWFTAGAVLIALFALALVRCDLTDTPYHLATARAALENFRWPTTNTFSHTFPDYPLYQQYPVYQTILYLVWSIAGFEGLSFLHWMGWTGLFLLWVRWWGRSAGVSFSLSR